MEIDVHFIIVSFLFDSAMNMHDCPVSKELAQLTVSLGRVANTIVCKDCVA